jgi:hypothetical protein
MELLGKMYEAPGKLEPVIKDMHRTLLENCERDAQIDINKQPPNIMWFRVENHPKEKEDGILRAHGVIASYLYNLYINPVSAFFEVVEGDGNMLDIEQLFYIVIQAMMQYRHMRRLPPMNTRVIDALAIEDSPPVTAENYMEIPPEDKSNKLGKLISENFPCVAFMDRNGRFVYYICCALSDEDPPPKRSPPDVNFLNGINRLNGGRGLPLGQLQALMAIHNTRGTSFPSTPRHVFLPMTCVPVYTELLNSFKAAFPSTNAKLFAVRWATAQRLYFVTEQGRIYCCKTDGSREFLNKRADFIFYVLSKSPYNSVENFAELAGIKKIPRSGPANTKQ